jgi:DNA-binding NarL/FixJ family response regulator
VLQFYEKKTSIGMRTQTPEPLLSLTEREMHILALAACGFSSQMIANNLSISINTVSNHRKNMVRKSRTRNIYQLLTVKKAEVERIILEKKLSPISM